MTYSSELKKYLKQTKSDPGKWDVILKKILEKYAPSVKELYFYLHSHDPSYKNIAGIHVNADKFVSSVTKSSDIYCWADASLQHCQTGMFKEPERLGLDKSWFGVVRLSDLMEQGAYYSLVFKMDHENNLATVENVLQDIQDMLKAILPAVQEIIASYSFCRINIQNNMLFLDMIDKSSSPAMLLNCEGQVLHSNRAATKGLSDSDSNFRIGADNRLLLRTKDQDIFLEKILEKIFYTNSKYDTAVPLVSGEGIYNDVFIARRVGNSTEESPWHQLFMGAPCALVSVRSCKAPIDLSPELIRDGMGLTRRESQLTSSLVNGSSLIEYSESAGIKKETTRWHMKQIQQKTGVSGQIDLVRRVLYQFSLFGLF